MTSPNINESAIIDYYDHCQVDYALVWQLDETLCMHYGYWDDTVPNHQAALRHMNYKVAESVSIRPGNHVLDAGCGVGGSSIYLASQGCSVEGISLSDHQVATSKENARRLGFEKQTRFTRQNYLATSFPDASFDVVWAIESVCYASNKADFTREAFRLLRPGGRLVVADFFSQPVVAGSAADKLMKKWTDAWAIHAYATLNEFEHALRLAGFTEIVDRDISPFVLPSARRLYMSFFPGLLTSLFAGWIGERNQLQMKNTWSSFYQYQAFKKGLWEYHIFSASKA